ncbi:uncharacterized protein V6R79_021174 [Siganus canaliculatus]
MPTFSTQLIPTKQPPCGEELFLLILTRGDSPWESLPPHIWMTAAKSAEVPSVSRLCGEEQVAVGQQVKPQLPEEKPSGKTDMNAFIRVTDGAFTEQNQQTLTPDCVWPGFLTKQAFSVQITLFYVITVLLI